MKDIPIPALEINELEVTLDALAYFHNKHDEPSITWELCRRVKEKLESAVRAQQLRDNPDVVLLRMSPSTITRAVRRK